MRLRNLFFFLAVEAFILVGYIHWTLEESFGGVSRSLIAIICQQIEHTITHHAKIPDSSSFTSVNDIGKCWFYILLIIVIPAVTLITIITVVACIGYIRCKKRKSWKSKP